MCGIQFGFYNGNLPQAGGQFHLEIHRANWLRASKRPKGYILLQGIAVSFPALLMELKKLESSEIPREPYNIDIMYYVTNNTYHIS